jgi:hypothetical protein
MGIVKSDVPEDMRQVIKTRYAESVEAEKEETSIFGRGAWGSTKAKASGMKGWWVYKGTDRMEVRRVYRGTGKWHIMGYAPKGENKEMCAEHQAGVVESESKQQTRGQHGRDGGSETERNRG